MLLGKYIYGKLSITSAITDLVGLRIYPVFLIQDAAYPAIVYTVNNEPLDSRMKDKGPYHDRATVTFHIWADHAQGQQGYDDLDAIDAALRTALDNVEGTVSGVTVEACRYEGSRDGRDEERTLFLREATYRFTTKN